MNINEFAASMRLGGARPNLFRVQFQSPFNSLLAVPFRVRAALLPAMTLGTLPAPYMGRVKKLPGNRTFEPWNVTIMEDEDLEIKNALEQWSNSINSMEGNVNTFNSPAPIEYETQATVSLLGKQNNVLREYTMINMWPKNVSQVQLDWETNDQIFQHDVEFEFDFFKVDGGITGTVSG